MTYGGQTITRPLSLGKEGLVQTVALNQRIERDPHQTRGDGWRLVWSDEFEGPAIDLSKWEYQTGAGGWGNKELEYYATRLENSRIEDGKLVIEARNDNYLPPSRLQLHLQLGPHADKEQGRLDLRPLRHSGEIAEGKRYLAGDLDDAYR